MWNNMILGGVKLTYIPINSSISTTGHKLQGKTLNQLVVNSWAYRCTHWVYVVLSRVKRLKSLVLNEEIDTERSFEAKKELVAWEQNMRNTIEKSTFKQRGTTDFDKYMNEEKTFII